MENLPTFSTNLYNTHSGHVPTAEVDLVHHGQITQRAAYLDRLAFRRRATFRFQVLS